MNIYGILAEVSGYGPSEDTREKCPYCHGRHTQFIDFEVTNIDDLTHEKHFCWDCQVPFDVAFDIPY